MTQSADDIANLRSRSTWLRLTVLAIGGLYLVFAYFVSLVKYDYPIPPGDDALRHMTEAHEIAATGNVIDPVARAASDNIIPDPPVFHTLMSAISQVTGLGTVETFQIFGRLMAVFVPFVAYILARRLFKRESPALMMFLLLAFFSPQPGQIYSEGSYLNIISAHVFLVFGLTALLNLLTVKVWRELAVPTGLTAVFFGAVYLSHPLSAIYLTLVLALLVGIFLVLGFKRRSWSPLRNLGLLVGVLSVTALPFAWQYYLGDIVEKFLSLAGSLVGPGASIDTASDALNFIPEQFRTTATTDTYLHFWGASIFVLGAIGMVMLFRTRHLDHGKSVMVAWIAALLIGSQTTLLQLPLRFARDLFVPMSMIAALALWLMFRGLRRTSAGPIAVVVAVLAVVIQILFGPANYTAATGYNGLVRVQDIDQQAITWIAEHTRPDDVLIGTPFVANAWGSYIALLTGRTVLDGAYCQNGKIDNTYKCDVIYNPNSLTAMEYYRDQNISYVYAGHPFLCCFIWQDQVDWDFHDPLSDAKYLKRVFSAASRNVGTTAIFEVDRSVLLREIAEAGQDL
ncbi:MAG: hypothetical protein HY976_04240 [Candidatus Kerfeldbacteria bacterium]|nr:hypothetical protein [Candidatus Kerfeldbacteria bacterium]